jgi:hypothetical protein
VKVQGYKVAAELVGTTLTATADGKIGKVALGTDERAIDLTQVTAVSFESAGMMKNGSLVLVDAAGKTQLHFRRKDNEAWKALYEDVAGLVPRDAVGASTKGASLVSEDRDGWHDRKVAEVEQRQAKREREKAEKERERARQEFEKAQQEFEKAQQEFEKAQQELTKAEKELDKAD